MQRKKGGGGGEAEKLSEADPLISSQACRRKPVQTRTLHSPSNTDTSLGGRTTQCVEGTFGIRAALYE